MTYLVIEIEIIELFILYVETIVSCKFEIEFSPFNTLFQPLWLPSFFEAFRKPASQQIGRTNEFIIIRKERTSFFRFITYSCGLSYHRLYRKLYFNSRHVSSRRESWSRDRECYRFFFSFNLNIFLSRIVLQISFYFSRNF